MVNGAAMKVRPVRQGEFMIPEFYLCLKMSCFHVCVISIYTKCLIYILSVCVCVFYNPRGVSLCHQIRDSDQHAFEAGRTSVKLIVPLHLRPALFFWGNNLSAGIQRRVWKEEGTATICRPWEILWSSSDFLLWIWADAPVPLPNNRLWVFHRRRNATSVKVQLFQSLTLALSFSLVSALRRTLSSSPVTLWQEELTSTTWCLWVLPFPFFSPHLLSSPLPLHPCSPPPPRTMLAVITNMALGNQQSFYMKWWHCKTFGLLNMFKVNTCSAHCRHKDVACINEHMQAPESVHTLRKCTPSRGKLLPICGFLSWGLVE